MVAEKSQGEDSPERNGSRRHRILWMAAVTLCLVIAALIFMRTRDGESPVGKQAGPALARAVPVSAAAAKKGEMNIFLNGLGAVTPIATVMVKSRVDGQLMEVLFREGQTVKSGELLARIDPKPFEVQLVQAEGQLARDEALIENAKLDVERYRLLWQQDSIPKQQLDTQEALIRQLEGAIKVDQGQIEGARLQLAYSRIESPLTGRTGLRLVDPGNIVHASDANGLVVITQLQPITVIFPIPEDSLPAVLKALGEGKRLPVYALNREQTEQLAAGSLLTVDNQIDPNTGTVRLRAIFDNNDNRLFPNQFVNARLRVEVKQGVILISASAIQRGAQGNYVYRVKTDRTATVSPVQVGEIQGAEASVKSGLKEGDLVVVDGAERLREGSTVELKGEGNGNGLRRSR
jgi:membrane fusion protein, multidrug efflux system